MTTDTRREENDYRSLDRLLEEADTSLGNGDRHAANKTLKQASVKATSMWGIVGGAQLPESTRLLLSLASEVQQSIAYPEEDGIQEMQRGLRDLRHRFGAEARG